MTNKGDAKRPDIRARFVGREFKWKPPEMENMFSACAIGILAAFVVTVPNAQEGGWRHDDDLVLECEDFWLGELQKALERVMILKRRANLGGKQAMTIL